MQLKNVVILNYHKISLRADIGLTARHPDDFKTDLQLVKDLGFKTITFYDLLNSQPSPTEKLVIITFDDGYKSVAEYALPLMKDLNFKGVVYIPTAFIGKTNDWDVQFGGKNTGISTKKICRTWRLMVSKLAPMESGIAR